MDHCDNENKNKNNPTIRSLICNINTFKESFKGSFCTNDKIQKCNSDINQIPENLNRLNTEYNQNYNYNNA